jgi:hypothetical protein
MLNLLVHHVTSWLQQNIIPRITTDCKLQSSCYINVFTIPWELVAYPKVSAEHTLGIAGLGTRWTSSIYSDMRRLLDFTFFYIDCRGSKPSRFSATIYRKAERQNAHGFSLCEHSCVNKKGRKNMFLFEVWYSYCRSIGNRVLSWNVSVKGYVVNPIYNILLYRNTGRRVDKTTRSLVAESGHLSKQCDSLRHLWDTKNFLCVKAQA